jgi:D-lactate dehydrogenase
LDTGDENSRIAFAETKPEFLSQIMALRDNGRQNKELSDKIRHKYSIKNVTGLNLLPLLEQDDPFEMIAHLLVGSEGILAFL